MSLKGYEILLENPNKGFYSAVAVIAENEEEAILYAKQKISFNYEVVRIETIDKGVIMTDSFYD